MRTVLSKDGTPIVYDQSGQGPALILVTGALTTRADWSNLAAHLAPHFTVFAYDRRGRGESGDTLPYAVEREVEDIDALITEAGGSAFIFGHSSGAALVLLSVLAACGGPPAAPTALSHPKAATVPPASTPTAISTPVPTPPPPSGFVLYTSPDHAFQVAYPSTWQLSRVPGPAAGVAFTGVGQVFEVSELVKMPGGTLAQIDNAYCQTWQADVAQSPVQTSDVTLAGQTWTRANCDAGVQGPSVAVMVKVVSYENAFYQMDYSSPIVEFASDNATYYAKIEQSFRFLR